MWMVQALEIADANGRGTGRYRMTAASDEGGGGPYGDTSHSHTSADEAMSCEACDEYMAGVTGFPSRKKSAADKESRERADLQRLKAKYEGG